MIIETIQTPPPKNAELNSRFLSRQGEGARPENEDDARAALEVRLNRLLEATQREQEQLEDLAIGCCI
jgi:hypothetical protein